MKCLDHQSDVRHYLHVSNHFSATALVFLWIGNAEVCIHIIIDRNWQTALQRNCRNHAEISSETQFTLNYESVQFPIAHLMDECHYCYRLWPVRAMSCCFVYRHRLSTYSDVIFVLSGMLDTPDVEKPTTGRWKRLSKRIISGDMSGKLIDLKSSGFRLPVKDAIPLAF